MKSEGEIVNRVAQSPLVTFDLEKYYHQGERVLFDIKDFLYEEMILREKEFRARIKEYNWSQFEGKNVAITCSVDAIVPTWAYMLLAINLSPYSHLVIYGNLEELESALFMDALSKINLDEFKGKKIVIKGCGKYPVPDSAYVEITRLLTPVASSIMYGEPCSTVPLYKRKVN